MTRLEFEYETSPWSGITAGDRTVWRQLMEERPGLASPFFSPGWYDTVHAVRGDVEVVRIRRDGEIKGFLPFARCPFGMLRPVGAPMADWHGLVGNSLSDNAVALIVKRRPPGAAATGRRPCRRFPRRR